MPPVPTHHLVDIAPEVQTAIGCGGPVVALESTIITHGMPYPQNVATARDVEAVIRDRGAVPATIAVVAGRIKVGLSAEQLEWLGTAQDVLKLSRSDLPYAISAKRHWIHDGGGHDDLRSLGGNRDFRNRRHWRRAPGFRGNDGCLCGFG